MLISRWFQFRRRRQRPQVAAVSREGLGSVVSQALNPGCRVGILPLRLQTGLSTTVATKQNPVRWRSAYFRGFLGFPENALRISPSPPVAEEGSQLGPQAQNRQKGESRAGSKRRWILVPTLTSGRAVGGGINRLHGYFQLREIQKSSTPARAASGAKRPLGHRMKSYDVAVRVGH